MEWFEVLQKLFEIERLPQRILLWGPPGTGKSSWASRFFEKVYRITLNEESAPEELIGSYILKGGDTVWVDGPAVRAMREGAILVIDEIHRAASSVETLLHAVLDDPEIAQLTLPTGEVVRPAEGFRVIATSNASPSVLDEALLDRFDLILYAKIPTTGALEKLPPELKKAVRNYYARIKADKFAPPPSYRRMVAFNSLRELLGQELAAQVVFGENWSEILHNISVAGGSRT